ncbi:MAG TPA: rhodanese-like domain-containing protein [Anaeromyxobacter sp.]|nr:rhodanese-like domain-containing protein [Anaeromyxobacter sp.]
MAPFDVTALSGLGFALTFLAVGFAFGAVLEMAGFGDTKKLAAQFYLSEMTVLKVMFTAIVVAAVLLAFAAAFGLLEMSRVFVNPTFLPAQVVGGLVMGVGFVIGGFCPGTSIVAASTFKVDGMLFVLGGLAGVALFGESVSSFSPFWLSGAMGRFTLPEWLGLSTGVTVLLVVLMALGAFWAGEAVERRFGPRPSPPDPLRGSSAQGGRPRWAWRPRAAWAGAGALVAAAATLAIRGDPTPAQRWRWQPAEVHQQLAERAPFASPAELVARRGDVALRVDVLDLRPEREFNLFHVGGARRIDPAALDAPGEVRRLLEEPPSTITFLVANGEADALEGWKRLVSRGVPNVYVLEGGVNGWLELYPAPPCVAKPEPGVAEGALAWRFAYATGDRLPSARPELVRSRSFQVPCGPAGPEGAAAGEHHWPRHPYTERVKPQVRSVVKGGCG